MMEVTEVLKNRLAAAVKMVMQVAGAIVDTQAAIAEELTAEDGWLGELTMESDTVRYDLADDIESITILATSKIDGVRFMRVTIELMPE